MKRNLLFVATLGVMTIIVYAFDIASNGFVLFLPVITLAIFQLTEKKSKR